MGLASLMTQRFAPLEVPDPITFVTGERWLNRGNLYPRQATLLKIVFLREDLFTDFDYEVVAEWTSNFTRTGNNGIQPDVLERMRWLRSQGHRWFREVVAVIGRRGGKGHIGALAFAYVLWCYMATGNPQEHYGLDRDKKIYALMFAGKRQQAKDNLWRDLVNVVTGSTCFLPYISQTLNESLSVYAPNDFERVRAQDAAGIYSDLDLATFMVVPRESTLQAGRGPTSFMQGYDEMAHVVATGANRSAEEVYAAATPSLDQFGVDAFIYEPSSPWQMMGQFYDNYLRSLEKDEHGAPLYPELLMIQLTSWDPYVDWERAEFLPLFPAGFAGDLGEYVLGEDELPEDPEILGEIVVAEDGSFVFNRATFQRLRNAVQTYDDQMRKLEMANPETFAVERKSHFATAIDAYLNEAKVRDMFADWVDGSGLERHLTMAKTGHLMITYKAHGDPSKSGANFGFAVAHAESVPDSREELLDDGTTRTVSFSRLHCVFDLIHHFDPADFPEHMIDYDEIETWVWDRVIMPFKPEEVTFDQWNSASTIGRLEKRVRAEAGKLQSKRVNIFEKTATRAYNWSRAETFKTALNMGWIHAPYYEQAELELRFLQEKRGAVDHPTSGPVQTKDVADCLMECVMVLIGEQVSNFRAGDMGSFGVTAASSGGNPYADMDADSEDRFRAMSGFGSGGRSRNPAQRDPGGYGTGRRSTGRSGWGRRG